MYLASRSLCVCAVVALAGLAGCGYGESDGMGAPRQSSPMMAKLNDAQIGAVLSAANSAEIQASELARTQASEQAVRDFAQQMIRDHSQADQRGSALLSQLGLNPADSQVSRDLRSQTRSMLASLQNQTGRDFDRAYINDQVTLHSDLLRRLDSQLIPDARHADLKSFLQDVRTTVASHLQHAQRIQATLGQ
jgi:putative membrane protein